MGLPGAGKTTLADELAPMLKAKRLNADEVRKAANDWDFSPEGRTRQAKRFPQLRGVNITVMPPPGIKTFKLLSAEIIGPGAFQPFYMSGMELKLVL